LEPSRSFSAMPKANAKTSTERIDEAKALVRAARRARDASRDASAKHAYRAAIEMLDNVAANANQSSPNARLSSRRDSVSPSTRKPLLTDQETASTLAKLARRELREAYPERRISSPHIGQHR
ncbi:MAG: hypothetical protein AAF745_13375, partial [Planctomycetota bacterium]